MDSQPDLHVHEFSDRSGHSGIRHAHANSDRPHEHPDDNLGARVEPDPDHVSGTAAEARADTLCWLIRDACRSYPDDSTAAILERIASLYRAGAEGAEQQSGSGQQPPSDDLRSAAGRDADDPDTRGATAGVPAGVGEPGAMPDVDLHTSGYVIPDRYLYIHVANTDGIRCDHCKRTVTHSHDLRNC